MSKVTKVQHYIWRGYLKRWTNDLNRFGRIYTFRKNPQGSQLEVEYARLDSVGFGKYYYDMTGISPKDISVVTQLIRYMKRDNLFKVDLDDELIKEADVKRDYIEKIIGEFENIDNQNHYIERIISDDLTFYVDSILQKTKDICEREFLNSMFGKRNISDKKLFELAKEALNHIDDYDSKYEFLRFFFMQQQRSPSVHEAVGKCFNELKKDNPQIDDVNTSFFVNTVMIYVSELVAFNLSTKYHTWIERLNNRTNVPFITGDCPVVNLTGNEIGNKHEFYFPLSPTVAMKLCSTHKHCVNAQNMNRSIVIDDSKDIENLNLRIVHEAYKEVFANNEDILYWVSCQKK